MNGVARSSSEAEYHVVADTRSEVRWVKSLLSKLKFPFDETPVIY